MKKESEIKVVRKVNHDSLWIKVSRKKSYAKILVTRNGVTAKATESMEAIAREMVAMFVEQNTKKGQNYGVTLERMEEQLKAKYC